MEHAIRTLQDQNQRRPRATRTHCPIRPQFVDEWDKLADQCIIIKAIGDWRKRLRACVVARGQFKHKM